MNSKIQRKGGKEPRKRKVVEVLPRCGGKKPRITNYGGKAPILPWYYCVSELTGCLCHEDRWVYHQMKPYLESSNSLRTSVLSLYGDGSFISSYYAEFYMSLWDKLDHFRGRLLPLFKADLIRRQNLYNQLISVGGRDGGLLDVIKVHINPVFDQFEYNQMDYLRGVITTFFPLLPRGTKINPLGFTLNTFGLLEDIRAHPVFKRRAKFTRYLRAEKYLSPTLEQSVAYVDYTGHEPYPHNRRLHFGPSFYSILRVVCLPAFCYYIDLYRYRDPVTIETLDLLCKN